MKKISLMITALLMLVGCSNEYNLTITNDKITEDINIVIPKSLLTNYDNQSSERNPETYVEEDDQITPFLSNDQYALKNKKYQKEVTEDNDNYYVNLNYEYKPEEFKEGRALSSCFENVTYENNNDYYLINLSGRFYCLYGEETVINVKTANVVEEENADEKKGNTYTWTINKDNVNDAKITLKVLKKTKVERYLLVGVLVATVSAVIIASVVMSQKIIDRKKTNEI